MRYINILKCEIQQMYYSLHHFLRSQWRAPEDTAQTRTEVTASVYRHTQLEAKCTLT